jgi:hypothetical protein
MAYLGIIASAPALLASSSPAQSQTPEVMHTMQPDIYKRMAELCEKIQLEKDQKALTRLIEELTHLLEDKQDPDRRLPTKKLPTTSA